MHMSVKSRDKKSVKSRVLLRRGGGSFPTGLRTADGAKDGEAGRERWWWWWW